MRFNAEKYNEKKRWYAIIQVPNWIKRILIFYESIFISKWSILIFEKEIDDEINESQNILNSKLKENSLFCFINLKYKKM